MMTTRQEEANDEKYNIKIIRRGLQQAGDDYHATVTRLSEAAARLHQYVEVVSQATVEPLVSES